MGNNKRLFSLFFTSLIFSFLFFSACASGPKTVELENKGSVERIPTPEWLKTYLDKGISALQARSEFADKYVVVGEETGTNRQFVLAWADAASAQQRIGALIRTSIASRYEAAVTATSGDASQYRQQIDNVITAVVNVSYSGAQREADWWSLRRRYDKDNKELFTDEYAAWVLYTIPKTEMNRQVSLALETSVTRDSALYDVTLALARDILLQGYDEKHVLNAAALRKAAVDSYDPPGSVTARAIDEGISPADEYLLGRDVAASVLSNYRVWDNPAMTEYVNMICSAIVINSPRPSTFNGYYAVILDSDEINAFASPAGHVFVTRGLVSSAKSEDALAAVIAHEIAHILLNHGIRAIQSNRDMEDWMNIFNSSGSRLVRDRINAGFSRAQEFDADITAMSLMAAAGYYPSALLDMLRELEKLQGGRSGGFNTTHPSPTSRLVNATVAAARYLNLRDTGSYRRGRFAAVSN